MPEQERITALFYCRPEAVPKTSIRADSSPRLRIGGGYCPLPQCHDFIPLFLVRYFPTGTKLAGRPGFIPLGGRYASRAGR